MKPNTHDIKIKRGTDYSLEIQMQDDNGYPEDLTGFEWYAQLRERPESDLHYDFVIDVTPEEAKVTMSLPHEVTNLILFNYGVYDLFYIKDANLRESLLQGEAMIMWKATEL